MSAGGDAARPAPTQAAPPRVAPSRLGHALRDALLMALVALALFGPLLGLKTVPLTTGLALESRWHLVAAAVAIVFAGRFLLRYLVWRADRPAGTAARPAASAPRGWFVKALTPALLLTALAWPLLPTTDRYLLDIGILILTYTMLAWGLNVVVGLAGLLDLGYVAFYAVGAYSYALLAQHFGWSFWICLPLAGILTAFAGILLGFPVLRLRGDYLAIVTLAFGEIIRLILINWYEFTGGPNGISGIPRPSFFGLPFTAGEGGFAAAFGLEHSPLHRIVFLYYVVLALALVTLAFTVRLRRLPVGMAWEALREDEIACRSLGINTRNTKLTAFAIGAMFGGFAGSFFATRQGFISPESFVFMESALILAIVVLGGLGSQIGIAIAALVMIGGIELLRNLAWLKAVFGPDFDPSLYRMLLFGLAMVTIMVWKPRGLVSARMPSIQLAQRKAVGAHLVGQGRG
ncbi:MAG TPA: high-affinity branched-chain amino acid ABC transporter permease LivM [Burkholderiales bacterium]